MTITKLFAVVALLAEPALAETQHPPAETKPVQNPGKPGKPAPAKQADGKPVPPPKPPAPAMAPTHPRVFGSGRPACGNVASRSARPNDCSKP